MASSDVMPPQHQQPSQSHPLSKHVHFDKESFIHDFVSSLLVDLKYDQSEGVNHTSDNNDDPEIDQESEEDNIPKGCADQEKENNQCSLSYSQSCHYIDSPASACISKAQLKAT